VCFPMAKRNKAAEKTVPKTGATPPARSITPVVGALTKNAEGLLVTTSVGVGAAEAAAIAGVNLRGIAALLGCAETTLRKVRERSPELDAAINRGLASLEAELVGLLVHSARQGRDLPAIYLLNTRFGYARDAAPPSQPGVTINLPAPLSMDAYLKQLKSANPALAAPTPTPKAGAER
jgi:hypothetical protein